MCLWSPDMTPDVVVSFETLEFFFCFMCANMIGQRSDHNPYK